MAVKIVEKSISRFDKKESYAGKEQRNENQNKIRTKPDRKDACG